MKGLRRIAFVKTFILFFLTLFPEIVLAQAPVQTDYEILESFYSECVRAIITYPAAEKGKPVRISFTEGIVPEKKLRILTEAILTAQGFSITEDDSKAEYQLSILIHEACITLQKKNREFIRDVSLRMYARCLDSSGVVLYAREIGKSGSDTLAESSLHTADTGSRFSNSARRTVLGEKPGKLKILSFLSMAAALAYFGLKQ